jgi:multimeric flavodoxin WrbA
MSNVVVVYHSGYGHTRVMAEAVAAGVERHLGSTCQLIPVEEVDGHWERLHNADAIIFGAPTYMGSASAAFKAFMEATAAFYLAQPWRDKLAAGFTNSGCLCGDKLNTLLQMAVFADAPPPEDRCTAAHLGERVARLADRMNPLPV